jgi:FkbM family methyltransferase
MLKEMMRTAFAGMVHQVRTVKVGHRITDSGVAKWICGNGVALANLRCGATAVVPIGEYVGRAMYLWGESDPRITDVIGAILQPGDEMLDIGANLGVTGLFAASRVGPNGRVHLFEPQPYVAQLLRTSLMINGYSQATVHEVALSDRSGSVEMEITRLDNLGMTRVVPSGTASAARMLCVKAEEAGGYVKGLNCRNVPLIKIDVEGHEPMILRALRESIRDLRVGAVLFECHLEESGFWEHESVQCLAEMGFEFLAFDMKPIWSSKLYPVTRDQRRPVGSDFVAVRAAELGDAARKNLEAMAAPFGLNWC